MTSQIAISREEFHRSVCRDIIYVNENGVPNFADLNSHASSLISASLLSLLNCCPTCKTKNTGQTNGKLFEDLVTRYLRSCFLKLNHLRPGKWGMGTKEVLARFEQYNHLTTLADAVKENPNLATILGSDYVIKPDIVVWREPEEDAEINKPADVVDESTALHAPLRKRNQSSPILHASLSCKWTIRSDRSQNSRTEALNLVRNRKGNLPHIVVVTAEPLPARIASIALGTGDIDCTYHFALNELQQAVQLSGLEDAKELLDIMVSGKRLRDISDLPLDLAV